MLLLATMAKYALNAKPNMYVRAIIPISLSLISIRQAPIATIISELEEDILAKGTWEGGKGRVGGVGRGGQKQTRKGGH